MGRVSLSCSAMLRNWWREGRILSKSLGIGKRSGLYMSDGLDWIHRTLGNNNLYGFEVLVFQERSELEIGG